MGIDGIYLYQLKTEIENGLNNARIDKIHQPSKEELVLLLRSASGAKRLLISIRPSAPRINFTQNTFENPSEPPMFCMLMRKYLSGARFIRVEDNGFERVVTLLFEGTNEMGDRVRFSLVTELIGKQTNLVLVGADGRIIDSLRRSDIEAGGRMIQPGAVYTLPEKQEKLNVIKTEPSEMIEAVKTAAMPLSKALVSVVDGFSPLIAREIVVRAGCDTDKYSNDLISAEETALIGALADFKQKLACPKPTVLVDDRGVPFEFSYTDITQYGTSANKMNFATLSELLDAVYTERDRKERIRSYANELFKLVNNLLSRTAKKIAIRKKEQEKCADGDKWRIYGELLKANLYAVERGVPYVDVQNYYDPELKTVRIPLNVTLTPAQNAQRYFKEYKKCCNAAAMLGQLIEESENELRYIESVADELGRASSVSDLNEIRSELALAGYIRERGDRKKQVRASAPLEFVSPDGHRVLVGRNNRQNDELTLRTASDGDMWFHTKNIPGSHVIVFCNGDELSDETVLFAAELAARHSKAAGSSSVPVDYTRVKYVKKPAGAKPGMVIYKTNKTVYVTPEGGSK
ncbi:MAG: NFACT family protein [Clostridia bacterium]|nr:NFACT family protein [Clostridia bacterium]